MNSMDEIRAEDAACRLRKAIEEMFYLFRLMGKSEDVLLAEVLLRRATMQFDEKIGRETWNCEEFVP